MKYLITVADDFGFTPGINKGCIEAYKEGILTEMSFMVDSPGSDDAVELVKRHEVKGIGIHLTLNDLNSTGKYYRTKDYEDLLQNGDSKKLQSRINDELKQFEDLFGRVPSHINSHHSLHQHEKIINVVAEYAGENNLFVRRATSFTDGKSVGVKDENEINNIILGTGAKVTDNIFEHIKSTYVESFEGFIKDLKEVLDNTVTEAFFHPAYVDDLLRSYSSLTDDRERDLKLLKDKGFKNKILKLGFKIKNFSEATL